MRKWTEAQENAINANGGTVLVSAAAGSGKTAVLVQRVINLITGENPVDVNRLLVVTFTNAAAAEMKSRISKSLQDIIRKDKTNANARRQLSLLPMTDICTIDSFCLKLVRENFFELNISNDFRLLDESENDLIANEAVNSVLDEYYEKADPNFIRLAEAFTQPDNDKNLIDIIKKLLQYIFAQPFPFEWLDEALKKYDPNVPFESSVWKKVLADEICPLLDDCSYLASCAVDALPAEEEYDKYRDLLNTERKYPDELRKLLDKDWDSFMKAALSLKFDRFPTVRKADPEIKGYVKLLRDQYKKILTDTKSGVPSFITGDSADYAEDVKILYPIYQSLIQVVKDTHQAIREIKSERSAYSFADIEHFALELLFEKDEEGNAVKSDYAKALEESYYEILVDEYQDTNEAQDRLFECLSSGKNRFMVGDVKQSIYRFRLAMPWIFTEKKNNYLPYNCNEPQFPAKIILDKNFRSRKGICEYVNHIFSLFMNTGAGELTYPKEDYLVPGADYEPEQAPSAQLHIINEVLSADMDKKEAEKIALLIQKKVKSGELIKDGDTYRPVRYGDFAILMRSLRSHAPEYAEVLQSMNVPVVCDNSTSLFDNAEIRLLLSLLQVIDNPMQDIPLLTVMTSPVYGFTPDELAQLRINAGNVRNFHNAVFSNKNCENDKCKAFTEDIHLLRKEAVTLSVSAFIRKLVRDKSILAFVSAMGNGDQRQANIECFIALADRFDMSNGVGLTSFLRYLDSIMNADRTVESAPVISSDSNAVKIMSVHHSKGLEFPICILASAGRKYNDRELSEKLLLHPVLGFASKCHDEEGFFDYPTSAHTAVKKKTYQAMMSESLRVLYVALTRAKEQFISFISLKNLETSINNCASILATGKPDPYLASRASSDATVLLTAALTHKDGKALRDLTEIDVPIIPADYSMEIVFEDGEVTEAQTAEDEDLTFDPKLLEVMKERFSYQYEYSDLSKISAKRTASDLDEKSFSPQFFASSVPAFMNTGGLTPAQKGTAMHTFMQFCDYQKAKTCPDDEISRMVENGYLSSDEAETIDRAKLKDFFDSDFAKRIFNSDKVYREFKISSFVPAREIENVSSDDKILVQGIADCVFEENGNLVLLDYKTDRVKDQSELFERYRKQLDFYVLAIEKTLKKPVKEVYLYSFSLSKPCLYK